LQCVISQLLNAAFVYRGAVWLFISERELAFAICYCPYVCLSSVTLLHPTQEVEIFVNISTAFGTLAIP